MQRDKLLMMTGGVECVQIKEDSVSADNWRWLFLIDLQTQDWWMDLHVLPWYNNVVSESIQLTNND